MSKNFDVNQEKQEQLIRGKRIKAIRENELRLNKTDLAKQIGISSQFLGLVEEGKGNLVYRSIKLLRDVSGHSADYILYGLDDNVLDKTKTYLEEYSEEEIIEALNTLKSLSNLLKAN
jgi:DNA-binding XRE family transcriptional regulator